MASLSPNAKQQFFTNAGVPAANCLLYTYATGTSTPLATYSDKAGSSANANPIILDARGEATVYLLDQEYRYVLKSADGLTTFWTRDNVSSSNYELRNDLATGVDSTFTQEGTGASQRANRAKLREVVSPEDFGCVGDGVTDDTVNMQKALDAIAAMGGGTLRFGRKKTYVTGYCTVSGNTIIDLNNSTWKARATLGAAEQLLSNKNYTGLPVNATSDDHITIRNGEFLTTIATDRTAGLLEFVKCGDLRLENVRITGPKYRGVLIYGCKRVWIDRCKVSGYGKSAVTPEGGSAIHVTAHFDGSTSEDVWITRNYILNGEWSAITITGNRLNVVGNHILAVKEAGIFGDPNVALISGNIINGVTKKDISASGIEVGGDYITIADNEVSNVNNVCISLTDVQSASVTGNRTINARRDAATFPAGCHISLLSHSASPNQSRDIKITGNTAFDYSSPSSAAVRVEGSGAGSAMVNLDISGNHFQGTVWASGKAVYIDPAYWTNASCRRRGNAGADDTAPRTIAHRTTNQAIANTTVTAVSFEAETADTPEDCWVIGAPTRFTVKAGTRRVRLSAKATFAASAAGTRAVWWQKNGAVFAGNGGTVVAGVATGQQINVVSAPVDVVVGDYFELMVYQDSGGALNLTGGTDLVYGCMEGVE